MNEETNNQEEPNVEINFDENGLANLEGLDMESILKEIDNYTPPKNPYTHEINFDNVTQFTDVLEVLKNLDISVDPNQWKGDTKYIKVKGE